MRFDTYTKGHDAFVFELDNVLYPEKDFLLQVYYLFSQFMEYSEQLDSAELLKFMQETYSESGPEQLFENTAIQFSIDEKYKLNFDLLQRNVRLPLKLLLFEPCSQFIKEIVAAGKPVFLLISGHPEAQLNKIKQVDWQGLEQYLTVYFTEELNDEKGDQALAYLLEKHQLVESNILMICETESGHHTPEVKVKYLAVDKLFLH
ncbi:FMN phosphatase YigB (HAD superfamily) [Pedobacter sp. CAN_A7]|uniref:haloacid dehalogenase n=1 Tax=Pedobacter sp. CAN_A7 TaxID=2787722 RepID=UPI0018CB9409